MLLQNIKDKAKQIESTLIEIRRHLHANPELSFEEYNTSKYIANILTKHNISHTTGIANTGIVAFIACNNKDAKTIALRADMDALPIEEKNEISYKSKIDGIMHACGHDVHSTCVLGACIIINSLKDELKTHVKIIFQPGEEKLPGGASIMIKEGVLKKPTVHSIIGQHVQNSIPVGKVGFRKGLYMASTDELYINIIGKGGHAAMPQENIDPIIASAHVIISLQDIVKKNINNTMPSVLSIGKVEAKGATNVIPDNVKLEGTFRTFDEDWRNIAHTLILDTVTITAQKYGCKVEIEIRKGYPFLKNDENFTQQNIELAKIYLGNENVIDLDLRMTAEDFAYYTHETLGCFYRLGTGNESKQLNFPVHHAQFNIDEDALIIGAGLMSYLILANEL